MPTCYRNLTSYQLFTRFINSNVTYIQKLRDTNLELSVNAHFIKDICPEVSNPRYHSWCVYAGAVRKDRNPFGYIVRYLHHPPISQHKIIETRRGKIIIRVKHPTTGLKENFTFTSDEFMKLFLAQFLPTSSPPLRYGTFNRHRGTKAQRHKV